MFEFIREFISIHNLPCTALLGMVVLYWLLVILGVLDADIEADAGEGFGDGGNDSPAPLHTSHSSSAGGGGPMPEMKSRLFSFGDVPLNIVGTFLAIFMWMISMISNYYLNGTPGNRSYTVALLLLIPNVILSLILTRILIIPFDKLFSAMQRTATESEEVVGREATVISAGVTEHYGQAEIATKAAPVLVNVRVKSGEPTLHRGAKVKIISGSPDAPFHFVEPLTLSEQPTHSQD